MEKLDSIKEWYASLEKREQNILLIGVAFVVFYLIYGVLYSGVVDTRDKYIKLNATDTKDLVWIRDAVSEINKIGGPNKAPSKSLSRLSDMSARKSNVQTSRFQPKGDDEAQVWLDGVQYDGLVDYMAALETSYGLVIDDLSVNATSDTGVVNARLKLSR